MRAGRIILISLGILLVILFFSTFINSTPKEEILIGAILPLTGNGADQGQAQAKAVQLVINEVNSKGGINGQKVELLLEDSKGGSAQEALIAYDKIKLSKKPLAIITWGSGVGIALTKLMNDDKIIQMGVATSSQKYSTANDFTFRVFPDARFEGAFDANFVFNKLNISTVCIIYTQNDYGVGSKSAFESSFSAIGGKVSCVESVDSGAKDVRSQLIKIKEKNPQLIFMGVYPSEGSSVLSQAKELDLNSKFIATSAIQGPELSDLPVDVSEGLLVSMMPFNVDSNESLTKEFRESYIAAYGVKPAMYASTAYDGARVVLSAINSCSPKLDSNCIKSALFAVRNFSGITGEINFDTNGDMIPVMKIMQYSKKQFSEYDLNN